MTSPTARTFVLDSSVLFHFSVADRLDTLGSLIPSDVQAVTTRAVKEELVAKEAEQPLVRLVNSAGWLQQVAVDGLDDLWVLSGWVRRLGADRHHRGEATVLAYAETHKAVALVDDRDARSLGNKTGLEVHGSLWLIAEACRLNLLPVAAAPGLIDTVAVTGARFPCNGSTFSTWAAQNGLVLAPVQRHTSP